MIYPGELVVRGVNAVRSVMLDSGCGRDEILVSVPPPVAAVLRSEGARCFTLADHLDPAPLVDELDLRFNGCEVRVSEDLGASVLLRVDGPGGYWRVEEGRLA